MVGQVAEPAKGYHTVDIRVVVVVGFVVERVASPTECLQNNVVGLVAGMLENNLCPIGEKEFLGTVFLVCLCIYYTALFWSGWHQWLNSFLGLKPFHIGSPCLAQFCLHLLGGGPGGVMPFLALHGYGDVIGGDEPFQYAVSFGRGYATVERAVEVAFLLDAGCGSVVEKMPLQLSAPMAVGCLVLGFYRLHGRLVHCRHHSLYLLTFKSIHQCALQFAYKGLYSLSPFAGIKLRRECEGALGGRYGVVAVGSAWRGERAVGGCRRFLYPVVEE